MKLDAAECKINQLFACFFFKKKYIFYLHQFKKFFRNCKAANRSSTSETNKKNTSASTIMQYRLPNTQPNETKRNTNSNGIDHLNQ